MSIYLNKNVLIQFQIFSLVLIVLLVFSLPSGTMAQEIKAAPLYEPENPRTHSHPDMDRWSYLPNELQASVAVSMKGTIVMLYPCSAQGICGRVPPGGEKKSIFRLCCGQTVVHGRCRWFPQH